MNHHLVPTQIKYKYFTPGMIVVTLVAINGLVFLAGRFFFGIGAVTNLSNIYPWGLWIGVDVAAGVALAAGGFVSAAMGHIFHLPKMHAIVRPALLTAMLGYTFVAFAVFVDIGRWFYIWHPLVMWNGTSPLFEVGICVMTYVTVLYVEFIPMVTERFKDKVKMPGLFKLFNNFVNWLLHSFDNTLGKAMFIFIIAGVVLSTLHQSSLGTLMIISGYKLHPLWQTPISPLLFFISAICVGIPMIIFESILASKSFKLEPEMDVLKKIASYVPMLLGIYLAFKLGDMVIRKTFVYAFTFDKYSVAYLIEIFLGIILPLGLLMSTKVLNSLKGLFISSSLVIFGVLLNRINTFIVAYTPPYVSKIYFPSYGEISVTLGCIALMVMLYRACVIIFPVISLPENLVKEEIK